jgi:hypothetical protein
MNKPISYSTALALLSIGLVACGGGGGGGAASVDPNGSFSLSVTDAAVDNATAVLVQFTAVSVKPTEGPAIDLSLTGDSQTCQDILDGTPASATPEGDTTVRCIDLLQLTGTQSAYLLQGVTLEAGNYNWLRLAVDAERGVMDSIIELDDGNVESLYVPSGSQSGLKLNTGFTVLAGGSSNFVIDFDLRKSVNDPKGFPDYRLKPSLRLIDLAESGNIVGMVEASLLQADECDESGYAVYVYEGGDDVIIGEEGSANAPLTSAQVSLNNGSGEWEYTVGFVAPGEYTVAFTCEAHLDDPEESNDLIEFVTSADSPTQVLADEDSVVNFSFVVL